MREGLGLVPPEVRREVVARRRRELGRDWGRRRCGSMTRSWPRWWSGGGPLTDAGRRETPLDQMLEAGLARPIRHGRNFVPGAAEVLQGQLPWLVAHLAALGIDSYAEMSRHLGTR